MLGGLKRGVGLFTGNLLLSLRLPQNVVVPAKHCGNHRSEPRVEVGLPIQLHCTPS